jgi:1-acyl-sn-glycerol-3-phosphate acyltransferase
VPRTGNRLTRALGRAALRVLGWRIDGTFPDVSRCLVIAAPHTSNWDFVVALATLLALGLRLHWLGKHTIFRGPLRQLWGALGGIPVDRSAAGGVVEGAVARFRGSGAMLVAIAPEGTRKRVERWKSGYYRIAHAAGVPILPVALDWPARTLRLLPLFEPTGDLARDEPLLRAHFHAGMARVPARYGA